MLSTKEKKSQKHDRRPLFVLLVILAFILESFYFYNMLSWKNAPDRGWIPIKELGPNIIGETTSSGEKAGLRYMDKIIALNGKTYETFRELYDNILDNEINHFNEYLLEREGEQFIVQVKNIELGIKNVLLNSGFMWLLGLIFIGIGILVFLMKPNSSSSWAFFLMCANLGILLSYSSPSFRFHQLWMYSIPIFTLPLFPGTIIHLTSRFPVRRVFLADAKWKIAIPYAVSLGLATAMRVMGAKIALVPNFLYNLMYVYLFVAIVFFLGSALYSYIRPVSIAVRLQSLVILTGIVLSFFVPLVEGISNILFKISFFPNPVLFYMFFFLFFPLSIGYAIVRHDLFEIDVIVRRTYGYILSTSTIIIIYTAIVSGLNVVTQTTDFSKSPLFSIVFALCVVFTFRPIHERIQGMVDKFFYRQKYDYRQTIKAISEKMIRILDPEQIYRTLIGSVVQEMSLENGALLLPNPDHGSFRVQIVEGDDPNNLLEKKLTEEDDLTRVLKKKNDVLLRHQVELHPDYEKKRDELQNSFDYISSELMLPLIYQDEIRGIISFGRKKSGRMFTPEDLDLLKTITNQSAVALENAKLFEENLEKTRMEEELKIAHDIQISMLPEEAPGIKGYSLAASSYPAREVGGDFYDFIEIGQGNKQKLGIIVGDVSGKAVSGALVMAASRSIFRVLADPDISVSEMVLKGNRRLKHDVKKGMFVALVYALLDPLEKKITIVNAGQTQPILCNKNSGKPSYIDNEGDRFPLGIIEDCDYQESIVSLKSGDTMVLYTDGIVEAMNEAGEMYGFEQFVEVIEQYCDLDADALLRKLMADVTHFVGDAEQHDDLTIVVLKAD